MKKTKKRSLVLALLTLTATASVLGAANAAANDKTDELLRTVATAQAEDAEAVEAAVLKHTRPSRINGNISSSSKELRYASGNRPSRP